MRQNHWKQKNVGISIRLKMVKIKGTSSIVWHILFNKVWQHSQATSHIRDQINTELTYFTLYNHTSGQHIRLTNNSKSSNSIQTSDSSQKNYSMAILDIRWPTKQEILAKKPKLVEWVKPMTSRWWNKPTCELLNHSPICPYICSNTYCSPCMSRDCPHRRRGSAGTRQSPHTSVFAHEWVTRVIVDKKCIGDDRKKKWSYICNQKQRILKANCRKTIITLYVVYKISKETEVVYIRLETSRYASIKYQRKDQQWDYVRSSA